MREEIMAIIDEINPGMDLEADDLNLAEDLSSMDLIALFEELEDKFDIELTMMEKTEENFRNVDTLCDMIERLQ